MNNPGQNQILPKKTIIPTLNPSQYIGNYDEEGRKKGFGILKWSNGTIFKGIFEKDNINGWGIVLYHNEDIFKGKFSDNIANGFGIYLYNSGKLKMGYWNNDILIGLGYELNDKEYYEGEFENDEKNGIGTFISNNNNKIIYEGEVKNNNYEGYGIKHSDKGAYYGFFKNNEIEGLGELLYESGLRYIGNFKSGKIEGFGIRYLLYKMYQIGIWKDEKTFIDGIYKQIIGKARPKFAIVKNGEKISIMGEKEFKESERFKEYYSPKFYAVMNFNIEPVRHLFEEDESSINCESDEEDEESN